ncbi:MAG: flavodoxin family protein [Candidatus Kaelpia aquatica]|nr:flavodoxin family protein [Candidatus Kaelpia aquatica]
MKALALIAGPRKGQATDSITDAVLRGINERQIETEKIYLHDLDIRPCLGCSNCHKIKECIIEDDHQMVLDKMDKSDIIVFASPTYVSNVTSVAKAFMDRSIRFFEMTKFGPRRLSDRPSKVILITSCGAPFPFSHILGFSSGCMRAMKAFFKPMNVKTKTLTATGIKDFDAKSCSGILKKAYKLGRTI